MVDLPLAIQALSSLLSLIATLKAQHGQTDDQILEHAKTVSAGNEAAYQALVKALSGPVTAPVPVQ